MSEQKSNSKIPYIFIAFFLVIFVVDFSYIYISQKTWRGITTQDSYHKGLKYNQALDAIKQQKNLGWEMNIKYLNDGNKAGVLTVALLDKRDLPIKHANITVNFKRPTQEGFDFSQDMLFEQNQYRSIISFPLRGQWDFEITASKGDAIMQETKRFVVQ